MRYIYVDYTKLERKKRVINFRKMIELQIKALKEMTYNHRKGIGDKEGVSNAAYSKSWFNENIQ